MIQPINGRAHYQSKDGKNSLTWHESGVWNLGSTSHLDTAWAWSKNDVSCPYDISDWSFWDETNQVQNARGSLEFDCLIPTGGSTKILR